MCRHQLPGWQQFWREHQSEAQLLSIAVDAGGAEAARPWVERAEATFPTLIDDANRLGKAWGFKVVPNVVCLDEAMRVVFQQYGRITIDNAETVRTLESFLNNPPALLPEQEDGTASELMARMAGEPTTVDSLAGDGAEVSARTLGEDALEAAAQGDSVTAARLLRDALAREPDNWILRKQLWRLLNPDRFGEAIDIEWQREQIRREEEMGVKDANPVPD